MKHFVKLTDETGRFFWINPLCIERFYPAGQYDKNNEPSPERQTTVHYTDGGQNNVQETPQMVDILICNALEPS